VPPSALTPPLLLDPPLLELLPEPPPEPPLLDPAPLEPPLLELAPLEPLPLDAPPSSPPPAEPPPLDPPPQLGATAMTQIAATMAPRMPMSESVALGSLVRDVELLCLDAGNTVAFLDHARLARFVGQHGFVTTTDALVRAEGEAKVALDEKRELHVAWSQAHVKPARGWAAVVGTMLHAAGLPLDRVPAMLDATWPEHRAHNFWSLVPEGLVEALVAVRATGVRVAIVSNSEGQLEPLLVHLGVRHALDLVIDSGIVGVEKPDPRIFRIALDRFDVPPARALHLGDVYATDVLGARAAGVRVALVDPYAHLAGRHADVPRVPGAREVATVLREARSARPE
jgi:putative hydrolase of the HAD superfamily